MFELLKKTLNLLEFDCIRESVASYALSAEAAKIIREELPLLIAQDIRERKNLVSMLCALLKNKGAYTQQELPEIGFLLPRLSVEGAVLELDETLALGLFIERGGDLLCFVKNDIDISAPDCASLAAEIFKIINKDGTIKDLPEIKKIRGRIQTLGKEIDKIAGLYSANETTRRMLQETLPSQRDGRLVLAVKANFKGRIKGIVHEVSSTGQTIFVEPEESVEKNNQLLVEKANMEAEVRRLLRELTTKLALRRDDIKEFYHKILFLECLMARARYSLATRGCFAQETASIKLIQAYHPLLKVNSNLGIVPIDFCVDSQTKMVIITGPNTGGKTVTLKTIGLFALMNQSGIALPAKEAALPLFDAVYADIGDEQSLSQSLSTFSAHMTNIAGIIDKATEHSLVLLDELGAGTDPEEGSAIAMAILDHFIQTKSTVVLTTHHGMLKNYGYSREGVENASVEFDSRTLSPTYRIVMGIPGESRAVDIIAHNGFPSALVERARSYLDEERSDVSALIAGLKEKHRELDKTTQSVRMEEERLKEERRHADLKELTLRQKERLLKQEAAAEFKRFLADSRKNLENLVRELREGELDRDKTLKVKEFIRDMEARSAQMDEALQAEEAAEKQLQLERQSTSAADLNSTYKPGQEVLAGPLRRRGKIIRADRKKSKKQNDGKDQRLKEQRLTEQRLTEQHWIIEIGSMRMSFPEHELSPLTNTNAPAANQTTVSWDAQLAPADSSQSLAKFELNLLGMRMEEAREALRRQIDAAVIQGLHNFSVIHGKGDGILQKGVHDYLREEPAVADYYFSRPELGGAGRTEVTLR